MGISLVATIVATIVSFVLGALWYGPLFANSWMAANGFTREELQQDFNPGMTYGTTFVLALVSAFVLGTLLGPRPSLGRATGTGLAVGLGCVAASLATNYLFERKGAPLILINGGYHAARFTLMGMAFGLLG
jgi:hypothetical protein